MPAKRVIHVLVVDDEAPDRDAVQAILEAEGYQVRAADNGQAALALVEHQAPDVVVSDLRMPAMDGFELLAALHARHEGLPVIFVTGTGDAPSAVRALRAGAAHYLVKPVDVDELLVAIERAVENRDVRAEAELLRRRLQEKERAGFEGILGDSPAMQKLYQLAAHVAPARATVLITGESGTGKGQLARAIHARSPRAARPFVPLHCASLAETLLESELFGHEKGSFTGADRRRLGRFEQAHGGTLFLDEIGEIPASVQLKLLRVLQERTFERVGGNEPIKVDVRLIAATNRDLQAEVRAGRFREDLYYRLNVVHLEAPPLRDRGDDILSLAEHFLRRFAAENGKPVVGFTEPAVAMLRAHRWPGNVRELENAVERAVVLARGTRVDVEDLPIRGAPGGDGSALPGAATLAELERRAILAALDAVGGSTLRAAEVLGVSVRMIQYRLRQYGMAKPRGRRRLRPADARREK